MTANKQRARHRSARRPITPLDDLAQAATGSIATVGRSSAIVAASSGLVMTMALPASAAPSDASASASTSAGLPSVDVGALTAEARAALATAPPVSVPADATWSFDVPEITIEANPEPPPPPPAPVRSTSSSRSTSRDAVPAQGAEVPASAVGSSVIEVASRYVGVPYVYGGSSPSGFDCSGFTQYVYAQLGISLPRSSSAQRNVGTVVSRSDAQPGDLIWSPGHVAIYAGGNQQIDAPRPGKSVQFRSIWQSNPVFIRVG